jgi:hypothetical protein
MTGEGLRQAIERPAYLAGGGFEPGLAELILRDVEGQAGGLPLLQHALLELWERRSGRRLTHTAYEAIGGVTGALEGRAEAVYYDFGEAEREICRQVFLRLTEPGAGTEDTKRRVAFRDLVPKGAAPETVEKVVHTLAGAEARLVAIEGTADERFVEVAHEALIRSWGRLRNWIDTDRAFLTWRKRLRFALEQWGDEAGDEGALLRGRVLAEAEDWLDRRAADLGPAERDFIQASLVLREREDRREREAMRKVLALEILARRAGQDLCGADLHGTELFGADLRGAELNKADLSGANLRGADLIWADLRGANLRGVNLGGANLRGTDLGGANLEETVYNDDTEWPEGFTPPPEAIKVD